MIRTRIFAVSVALSMAALMLAASTRTAAQTSASAQASADRSAAMTGIVSSQAEGPMEGVVVSATRTGSTMTVSVMSDAQGRYAFPANRLEPGAYSIRIRATGYDLESPSAVDVTGRTSLDLKLRKTQDLAAQLTRPTVPAQLFQLRWMIEEYRVSLFAQELKTLMKVSDKRLAEQLEAARVEARG